MANYRIGLVPTVFALIFIIKMAFWHFEDPDFYWHIKTGEVIVNSATLPSVDIFSYTFNGKHWVLHEWLFQVILYVIYHYFGFPGVSVLVALSYTTICYFLFKIAVVLLDGSEGQALIITLLCGGLFVWLTPRPFIATFLFFAFFLYRLIVFKYCKRYSALWVFPVIMIVWVNLHGGYFIGIFELILFLACEWLSPVSEVEKTIRRRNLIKLTWITVLSVLVTLVNPYFIDMWLYPFQVIGMDASKWLISEWQSPNFHQPYPLYFLFVVIGTVGLGVYSGRRIDITEFVFPVAFIASAFLSIRNIPLAAIAVAPTISLQLKDSIGRLRLTSAGDGSPEKKGIKHKILKRIIDSSIRGKDISVRAESFMNVMLIGAALASVYVRHKEVVKKLDIITPVRAVDFLLKNNIQGNVFNAYKYGGYLIYRLYPGQKVFIDGRADMYGDAFLRKFVDVYQGRKNWQNEFMKYNIDYVVCESDSPIRQLLIQSKEFKLVFDDNSNSVLLKDVNKFKVIIKRYAIKLGN